MNEADNAKALPYADPTTRPGRRSSGALRLVAAAVLMIAVFLAGVLSSGTLRGWFHLGHDHADAAASGGKQLWTCGMHPQVIQDRPGDCPICHMELTPLKASASGGGAAAGGERKVKYWWDPMTSPPYISQAPGKSPMGMDLTPVSQSSRCSWCTSSVGRSPRRSGTRSTGFPWRCTSRSSGS